MVDEDGGHLGGVIPFLHDGYLAYLEMYTWKPDPIREWPRDDRLRLLPRDA